MVLVLIFETSKLLLSTLASKLLCIFPVTPESENISPGEITLSVLLQIIFPVNVKLGVDTFPEKLPS